MKKAFWVLALGALASAIMAASVGRAQDAAPKIPVAKVPVVDAAKGRAH